MAIYVDTNVLPRSFRLPDTDYDLLKALADELGQVLKLSVVVLEESVAQCERDSREAFERLEVALRKVRTFHQVSSLHLPQPEAVASKWRDALCGAFHIEPLDPLDAEEALRREAWRVPPAREAGKERYGVGARDAALWLSAKREHLADSDKVTFFISRNTKDFGHGSPAVLRPALAAELGEAGSSFHYCESVEALLQFAGKEVPPPTDFLEVAVASPKVAEALSEWIVRMPQAGLLRTKSGGLVGFAGGAPTVTNIYEVTVTAAEQLQAFEIDGRKVVFGWLSSRFVYDVEYGDPSVGGFEVETVCDLRTSVRISPEGLFVDPSITAWRNASTTITRNRSAFVVWSKSPAEQKAFDLGDEIDI